MGNQQPVNGSAHGGGMPSDPQQRQGGGGGGGGVYPPGPYNMTAPPPMQGGGGGGGGGSYPPNFDTAMQRTSSDASMTMMDHTMTTTTAGGPTSGSHHHHQQHQQHHHSNEGHHGSVPHASNANSSTQNWLDDDTVPTVFRWEHGGRQVYITGTFNGWSRQIPMHRSGNDFTYIHNLKRGKHAFKFIVDDEWRFAPDQPTVADIEGRINNFIDVTDFKAYTGDRDFEKEKAAAEYGGTATEAAEDDVGPTTSGGPQPDRDGEVFSNNMPDVDDYTREPPPLPPHLRYIILNKPPQLQDTAALPVPQHVALNHLYCTAIKDNMMVLGITQRYKTKFVTTVYYSPCK